MYEKLLTQECMFAILLREQLFVTFVRFMEDDMMSKTMRTTANLYNNPELYDTSILRSLNNRKRREKQLRRRIITTLVMASVIIFLVMFISFSFMSDASANKDHEQYRYYSSVTVTAGDSVWSIANEYMDPLHYRSVKALVNDIASVNRISSDAKLVAGSQIIVPYYSDEIK